MTTLFTSNELQILGKERSREADVLHKNLIAYFNGKTDFTKLQDQLHHRLAQKDRGLPLLIEERSPNGTTDLMYAFWVPFTQSNRMIQFYNESGVLNKKVTPHDIGDTESFKQFQKVFRKAIAKLPALQQDEIRKQEDEARKEVEKTAWKGFQKLWWLVESILPKDADPKQDRFLRYICAQDKNGSNLLLQGVRDLGPENFRKLTDKIQTCHNGLALKELIVHPSTDGFNLLMLAARSGDEQLFSTALEVAQTSIGKEPEAYKELFTQTSSDGFGLLRDAIRSGNEKIFTAALEATKQALGKDSDEYKVLLTQTTTDGFSLLEDAVKAGNPSFFNTILSEVQQALGKDSPQYKALLTQSTSFGFNILVDAAHHGNDALFAKALGAVQEALGKDSKEYKALLTQTTTDGFNMLLEAAYHGNEALFAKALTAAQEALGKDSEEYKALLTQTNNDGFNLLMQAATRENQRIFDTALGASQEALGKGSAAMRALLCQRTSADYTILHSLARTPHLEAGWQALQCLDPADKRSLFEQATNRFRGGFLPLHDVCFASGDMREIRTRLSHLLQFAVDAYGLEAAQNKVEEQMSQPTTESRPRSIRGRQSLHANVKQDLENFIHAGELPDLSKGQHAAAAGTSVALQNRGRK